MLSLTTWKNEIKGHTCVCIRPEEKLKKKKKQLQNKGTNLIIITFEIQDNMT